MLMGVGVVRVAGRRRRLIRSSGRRRRRRSRTTLVVRRRESVRRCSSRSRSRSRSRWRRPPRFRFGFFGIAARKALDSDERRVLERGVVVCEFCPARILDLLVHGDVRSRVVVLGNKVGMVDVEAGLSCDGAVGKDGVEGRDIKGAGPVAQVISTSSRRLLSRECGNAHGWVAQARRTEVGVSSATRRSCPCSH